MSSIAAAISTAGLLSMAALGDWGRRNSPYFSSFAIGVLLVAVIFHILPQALSLSETAWRWGVAGFFAMTLIGATLRIAPQHRVKGADFAFGYASIIALGAHSFLDGVIYVTSFHEDVFTGGLAALGLLFHEFPEGVIAFFLLREAGMRTFAAIFWAFVAASVTTVAGTLLSAVFIGLAAETPLSAMLGATAGGLIYIIFFHLAPHAAKTPNGRGYPTASIGVVIALLAVIFRHA
ncbi:MAG: ZIP family metal transporter [Parvularculaceae bacterium]